VNIAIALLALIALGPSFASAADDARRAATPPESIYQVVGAFRDQNDRPVRLAVSEGHPVLVSMFYASCPDACPLLIAELQRIEASLSPAVRADLRVVLVSFDPERDTPRALKELAARYRLDETRWSLLTGADDTVREVAAVLGVKVRKLSKGMFNHSSVIAVLDRHGVITERIDGITPGDPKTVERLRPALQRAGH